MKSSKVYGRSNYIKKSKTFKSFEDVNISGKSIMVIGGSGTIGKAVCEYMVKKDGITLHVTYENEEKGQKLKDNLKEKAHENATIVYHKVDLANMSEVKKFIDNFIQSKNPLHVLINCTSKTSQKDKRDNQGTDYSFLVNVLSPYLLITKFADYMNSDPDRNFKKRIIGLTCGVILTVNVHFYDIELRDIPFNSLYQFSHEKKQQATLIFSMASKYPEIQFSNIIPGLINTSDAKKLIPEDRSKLHSDVREPEEGADSVLWLAISDDCLRFKSGEIFLDREIYKYSFPNIPNTIKSTVEQLYMFELQSVLARYDETTKPP